MCETPKSPPGDYNVYLLVSSPGSQVRVRVKHLNPRQGITTWCRRAAKFAYRARCGVKHLNPRQGITTAFDPDADIGDWTPYV